MLSAVLAVRPQRPPSLRRRRHTKKRGIDELMPRSSSKDGPPASGPKPTIETALGVKGGLRVRPYGNVKHAHVILRKVDEETYEGEDGRKKTRGVFSLFASKLINVKAGKELFLYIHPANGDVQEYPVAFEADLVDKDAPPEAPVPEKRSRKDGDEPGQRVQVLPPKMRKMLTKNRAASVATSASAFSLFY